jgi:hypothetical protein
MADAPAWATEKAPDWAAATPPAEKPSAPSRLAAAGAAVADIPLSMPGMFIQTVDEWGHAAYAQMRDLPEHAGMVPERVPASGKRGVWSVQAQAELNQAMLQPGKEQMSEARQHAQELLPEWAKSPAQSLFKVLGGKKETYQDSLPSQAMKHVGSWMEHGANFLEKQTGMPSEFYLSAGDAAMLAGGAKMPSFIKSRFAKPNEHAVQARLLTQRPTGSKGPAIVTPEQVSAVAAELDKEHSAPTKPVDSPEMVAAKRKRAHLAEGEYISSPGEGDLGDWSVAHDAHKARVEGVKKGSDWDIAEDAKRQREMERVRDIKNKEAPEYVPPGGEVPPIEAYEGAMQPPRQIAEQVRHITDDPDIHSPDVTTAQLAQDLAAERSADVIRPNKAVRPASVADYVNRMGGKNADLAVVAEQLKVAGFDVDTAAADGGVAQVEAMLRDEKSGRLSLQFVDEIASNASRWVQGGKVRPRLAVPFGIMVTGAVVGSAIDPDSPIAGAFEGAAAGFALANLGRAAVDYGVGTKMGQVWDAIKPSSDPARMEVVRTVFARIANIKAGTREVGGLQRAMNKAIPKERLEEITHLVEQNRMDELTPGERYHVQKVKDWYNKIGTMAQEAGVIKRLIAKNFVPHMWDMSDAATKKFFDEGGFERANANVFTPHGLKRGVESYAQGISVGLKPKTLNYSEILGIYANSVIRAVHNAEALTTLKTTALGDGTHPVEMAGMEPKGYIRKHGIEGLEGYAVHPEAVKALQRAFDSYDPGVIERALLSTAFTFKRVAVSYSFFHPAALTLAYLGAGGNPVDFALGAAARGVEKATGGRVKIPYESAVDSALNEFYKGGSGDMADWGIRNGLELGTPIEDVVGKKTFDRMTNAIDTALGSDIHGLKPFEKLDSSVHSFIWNYTQAGMKLVVFQKEFSRAIIDPKNLGRDMNDIAADVSSYTNNVFGTLNWERIIERQKSRASRAVAGAAFSKKGLSVAQIVSFAPDWMVSTIRTWTQAVPGMTETAMTGRLHRAYIARGLLYSMAVADAVNIAYSGHHVWENDFRSQRQQGKEGEQGWLEHLHDLTFIDLGDGRKMQYNKHLFEFVHAITDPGSFAANKASMIITDPINVLSNRQWASFGFAPPISTSKDSAQRAEDIAKWEVEHHLPITVQQVLKGNFGGMAGLPITGMTAKQKQQLREEERAKK